MYNNNGVGEFKGPLDVVDDLGFSEWHIGVDEVVVLDGVPLVVDDENVVLNNGGQEHVLAIDGF